MKYTKRNCDYCKKEYRADNRNLKRGWGLCCSKKCAAKKREKSKPNYNKERANISSEHGKFYGYSPEGSKLYQLDDGSITSVDKYGEASYGGYEHDVDAHPFDLDY